MNIINKLYLYNNKKYIYFFIFERIFLININKNNYSIKTIKYYLLLINIINNIIYFYCCDENFFVLNSPNIFLLKTDIPRF